MPENVEDILARYSKEVRASLPKEPSERSKNEASYYEDEERKFQNERYKSDTEDRKWLAQWTASAVTGWLIFVAIILTNNYGLSDTVLVALLGTTTLNVLGLSYIVLRGHFKASEKEN
jgi:hypothetical protein